MAFNSLEAAIAALERQPGWEQLNLYRRAVSSWPAVVGPNLARVSRPVSLTRQVLWVATSSAVVAQDLSFKRYDLLKKLNQVLNADFVDLRFSAAKWHSDRRSAPKPGAIEPSSASLELCPACNTPTPARELKRWQICACCAARQWSTKQIQS